MDNTIQSCIAAEDAFGVAAAAAVAVAPGASVAGPVAVASDVVHAFSSNEHIHSFYEEQGRHGPLTPVRSRYLHGRGPLPGIEQLRDNR